MFLERNRTLDNKIKIYNKLAIIIFFFLLCIALYIFFRYVHPVVPWDGDDWRTIGTNMSKFEYGFPRFGLSHKESERLMCWFFGGLFGHVAAFVVYPLTGDYVNSFVSMSAFGLAMSITISVYFIYIFLFRQNNNVCQSILVTIFYLVSGFILFKNTDPSTFLFWQYNYCTVFYYSIPSYLASAFALYIIDKHLSETKFIFDINSGVCMVVLYFLMFSFVPAALLVAAASFFIVLDSVIKWKKLKDVISNCWFHFIALLMFAIKLFFEFFSEFTSGYFSQPTDVVTRLKDSFLFVISSFLKMNKLFLSVSVCIILFSLIVRFYKSFNKNFDDFDKRWKRLIFLLLGTFLLVAVYFILFGVISMSHLHREGLVVRMDTMYVFYFLVIIIVTECLMYVLSSLKKISVIMPLVIVIMAITMISPANHYSDSIYNDTATMQRYELMTEIVAAAQNVDSHGGTQLIVHMPKYGHYGGSGMGYDLYMHNMTSKYISIDFVYEDNLSEIYFE